MFICIFLFTVCLFHFSNLNFVFGQQSPAELVIKKYRRTLIMREDVRILLPNALNAFKESEFQDILVFDDIEVYLKKPIFLRTYSPKIDDKFIALLYIDDDLRKLFGDMQFFNVLKNDDQINKLVELIENMLKLRIFFGGDQTGKTGTSLLEPFIVEVKDEENNPVEGISVTFRVTKGSGLLSDPSPTTNSNGQATTTFTLGLTPGISRIEASVVGISEKVIFTATATEMIVSITPSRVDSPDVGEPLVLELRIANAEDVAGYQATVQFDPNALEYVESANGDFLPEGAIWINPAKTMDSVTLAAVAFDSATSRRGLLATLTFKVVAVKTSTLTLSEVILLESDGKPSGPHVEDREAVVSPSPDVNGNGAIDVMDLVLVASNFGETEQNLAYDINGDGKVNILDLVLVAVEFGTIESAPSVHALTQARISAADVQTWLIQAKTLDLNIPETTKANPAYQRGVAVLENLLATLTQTETVSKKTALLLNYPNPFNPETWIPYQLAETTDVTVTIRSMKGTLIRTLSLGHQQAGLYRSKSRAAYWDGRNEFGEKAASGLYFYTFTAGSFSATGKMLIRK